MRWRDRLERWAPYRRLRNGLLLLVASGLWLHWTPRFSSPTWGFVEWTHSAIGIVSIPLVLAYLGHHLPTQWPRRHRAAVRSGLLLVGGLAVLTWTGCELLGPIDGAESERTRSVHFAVTFAVIAGLGWHLRTTARGRPEGEG